MNEWMDSGGGFKGQGEMRGPRALVEGSGKWHWMGEQVTSLPK